MRMSAYYASRQRQFSAARHYRLSAGGCCDDPAVAGGGPLQPEEIHLHIPYAPMGPFCSRGFGLWVKHGYLNAFLTGYSEHQRIVVDRNLEKTHPFLRFHDEVVGVFFVALLDNLLSLKPLIGRLDAKLLTTCGSSDAHWVFGHHLETRFGFLLAKTKDICWGVWGTWLWFIIVFFGLEKTRIWNTFLEQTQVQCFAKKNMWSVVMRFCLFHKIPSRELTYPPKNGILKMIFLFPRWDMLIPWRVS